MKILYIPGLGDGFVLQLQKIFITILNSFRSQQNKIAVFESRWSTKESFDDKLGRLEKFYEQSSKPNCIVAPSAGGALAITLYSEAKSIDEVHTVCAKLKGSEKIGSDYQNRAPALLDTVRASEKILQNIPHEQLFCYVPNNSYDGVVEREDMMITSAQIITLPNLRHSMAIFYWLLRYLPKL